MIPNWPDLPLESADWLLALLFGLVLAVPLVSERLRVPPIVGLILAGSLIGPGGLNLVQREGTVAALATMGLLYLVFTAGVELDLDEFVAHRRDSLLFGVITFIVPMGLGFLSTYLLGFGILASILIASCWASHTLLAYPVFRRYGTVGNRAVSTAVGGTIVTDVGALVVLVVVASAHRGALSASFWALLSGGMTLLVLFTLVGLPRIGRWFFTRFAHDQGVRFAFVLFALFGSSALAHLAGLEPIIGAFFAGLALNRLVPNGSQLMGRIEFIGANFLNPLFLLSVGLLINVRLLGDPQTLLNAVVFTCVAVGAKLLAAIGSRHLLRYTRDEGGALFALSNAQAAATLAAIIVGLEVGLIGPDVVNAVVMVILVTCLVSSVVASRIAPRLTRPVPRRVLGRAVVLPVVRAESAAPLARLAASFASADGGVVLPLTVVVGESSADALEAAREVNATVEQVARAHGVEAEGLVRIDATPALGVLNTLRERSASLVVMGWHGPDHRAMFRQGATANPIVADAHTPVLLAGITGGQPARVVLLVPHSDPSPIGVGNLRLAMVTVQRLSELHRCQIAVVSCVDDVNVQAAIQTDLAVAADVDARPAAVVAGERLGPDDILVVPSHSDDIHLRGAERLRRAAGTAEIIVAVGGAPAPPARRGGRRRHAEVPLSPVA